MVNAARLLPILVWVVVSASSVASPLLEKTDLFEELSDGFVLYRIPGVVVTAKGTVLTYCEARKLSVGDRGEIEVHMRRSADGGRTWDAARQIAHLGPRLPRNPHLPPGLKRENTDGPDAQTVNNPVAIAGQDGRVHFLYCVEYMRCFYIRSEDDGATWSKPIEITAAFDGFRARCDLQAIATGPGHGIQLRGGRLVVPVWIANYTGGDSVFRAAAVIYSDDNGDTWEPGEIVAVGGNEANVAQCPDGRVLLTARNGFPERRRMAAYSADGATQWSKPEFIEELLEPGCMAGMVSHPGTSETNRPLLLFSHLNTTDDPHSKRRDVTIKLSYDGGRTWPVGRLLQPGPSAYSDLAVLPDGTILCFYESGRPGADRLNRPWQYACLKMARFNLAWILESPGLQ